MNIPRIDSLSEITNFQTVSISENQEQNGVSSTKQLVEKLLVRQSADVNNVSLTADADFVDEDETNTSNNAPKIGEEFKISYKSVKCTGNPDTDAKNFAEANNITVDEAKRILSSKFGAPGSNSNAPKIGEDMIVDYVAVKSTGNPDIDAKNFAEANNISLEKAKALLEEKYGKPVQNNNTQNNLPIPPEMAAKLEELGIPKDVIKQGDDAIKKYAEDNHITLPAKTDASSSSSSSGSSANVSQTDNSTNNSSAAQENLSIPPEEAAKLEELGIPKDVIKQGDAAIKKYAEEHNITLPAKTDASQSSSSSGTVGSDTSSNDTKTDDSSSTDKADSASSVSSKENKLASIKSKIKSAEQGVSNTYDRMAKSGFKLGLTQWADAVCTFSSCVAQLIAYSSEYSSLSSRLNKLNHALDIGRSNLSKAASAIITAYNGVKTQVDKLI